MRYCLITESTVKKESEAHYYSRGQKYLFEAKAEEEDRAVDQQMEEEWEGEEDDRIRASG